MTIGPAPMIRIDLMSVRLGIVLFRHSGARGSANPESRSGLGVFIWIPGPALRAVPE
jgi:hypothetical protein